MAQINPDLRLAMVQLVENLIEAFDLEISLLFKTLGIMDRYMAILSISDKQDFPSLITLSIVCLRLACKAECISGQDPSYDEMLDHLREFQPITIK